MSWGKNGSTGLNLDQGYTGTREKTPDSIRAKDFRKVSCKLTSLHLELCRRHCNQGDEDHCIDGHVQTKIDEAVDGNSAKTNRRPQTNSSRKAIGGA